MQMVTVLKFTAASQKLFIGAETIQSKYLASKDVYRLSCGSDSDAVHEQPGHELYEEVLHHDHGGGALDVQGHDLNKNWS